MFETIFRIVLEIFLIFATALFIEKARGYWKYLKGRFLSEDKEIPIYAFINWVAYIGIAVIGIYDVCDNFITLIKLF